MKLTPEQTYHVGWLVARNAEEEICTMADEGHTLKEILNTFEGLSTRALKECLKQNKVINTGNLQSGKRSKDKNKRKRRSNSQIRQAGGMTAGMKRADEAFSERDLRDDANYF